ncbi:DoxX family membrane protein [Granulicella sibirica]|nr:DoxX family membrane protein [Granulicella sibirica]
MVLALSTAASWLQSPFLLVVRLYWGWQFAQTGWGKLHNLQKTMDFFDSPDIRFPRRTRILSRALNWLAAPF